jgi:hypothetical protein
MEDRAGKQSSGTNGTSCTLDWPTAEMLRAARGAKAKALWDGVGLWALADAEGSPARFRRQPISRRPPLRSSEMLDATNAGCTYTWRP